MYVSADDPKFVNAMSRYDFLRTYTTPVKKMERELVGRDNEIRSLMAAFERAELSNVILLGPAGSGKTSLVQGCMKRDRDRVYLEVDLSRMIAELPNVDELGNKLKQLFYEAGEFVKRESHGVVLFIDEFHQIVQLSPAAVEALKPLLADSATRNIRVIAATTYVEFRQFISPNQPLVERLQRINLKEPDKDTTVAILKGMAKRYGVDDKIIGNALYELIYEYTNRYIPANAQPRKSILILDAMVGWHRAEHRKLDKKLLADVIYESEGVNVAFRVDANKIKKTLDTRVLAQEYATTVVEQRLQLCVADLNDKSKPQSSFLLTGSTGVGKQIADYELVPILDKTGNLAFKRHGDLQVGDYVFARNGKPTEVLGVFPHKNIDMYRVTLSDGRTLDVGDEHLWAVYTAKMRSNSHKGKIVSPRVMTTKEIFDSGVVREYGKSSRKHLKYFIPMNQAVDTEPIDYNVDPYVIGALIGDGCLRDCSLGLSSEDVEIVEEVATLLHASGYRKSKWNYTWNFTFDDETLSYYPLKYDSVNRKFLSTFDVIGDIPEIYNVYSGERRIPESYMIGSIDQRWALVQGLFDTDGSVSDDDRCRVSYSTNSKQLADDVVRLLHSLGISSKCSKISRMRERIGGQKEEISYVVRVRCSNFDKPRFFRLPRKVAIASKGLEHEQSRVRVKKFDMVGISDISYIGKQNAKCIYVADDEHLYQAGDFIVTHNTELTKQLSMLLFGDAHRSLIRLDCSEYANADSLERFRLEITSRVWERPYCILLLDEVEKACPEVTRVLLSVLDDGRLTDQNGREVSFLNCYVVMTTNAGSEIYKTIAQYEANDKGSGEFVARYDRLIRRSLTASTGGVKFPPELLGRIDCIVPFQPLSRDTMEKIVIMKLKDLRRKLLDKYGVEMVVDARVLKYLVEDSLTTDSDSGGARAVMAKLESEVTTAIARFINTYPEVRLINVKMEGTLVSEDKASLVSDSHVKIYGVSD